MDILQMSVQAGMLIAVVILIRSLTLYRLPKVSFLILWGMVLLRMLVPFSVSTKWSIYNLFSVLPGDPHAGVTQEAGTLAGGKSALWSGSVPGQLRDAVSRGEGIFSSPLAEKIIYFVQHDSVKPCCRIFLVSQTAAAPYSLVSAVLYNIACVIGIMYIAEGKSVIPVVIFDQKPFYLLLLRFSVTQNLHLASSLFPV